MFQRSNIHNISKNDVHNKLSFFDTFNWSHEPKEPFIELCRQRAQQIRDSHDHIILSFSGGTDSTTVLNTFTNNKIPIDEILIVRYDIEAPCLDGKKAIADLISRKYTGIVNIVTISYEILMNYIKRKYVIEERPNFSGHLHAIMRYNTHYLEQHGFAQPKVRHGKICHLYGESDPEVFLLGDKPYARSSIKHHFVSSHDSMNTLFFTDSTFPQLHVKQSYVVAKQLVKTPKMTHTEKKLLVRDFYSPAISPVKSSDDAQFTYKNKTTYSEPTLILNAFSKMEDFSRAYNSVQFPQLELSRKIKELSDQTYRYHLLELGADTPSNE